MTNWKSILISPAATIRDAVRTIDSGQLQIALIVDSDGRLLGTVSDGDVRRAILHGISLDSPASEIMNPKPTVATHNDDRNTILAVLQAKQLRRIPIVDDERRVVGLESLDELVRHPIRDNVVVLLAGGLGTRLRPLTNDTPKPMLTVGGKPLLEIIILNFIEFGFRRFYISVNYKAEIVENYFGDGSKWNIDIQYIHEGEKLGTAGPLGLLPNRPEHAMIVMNGDLLTKVDFDLLLNFHSAHRARATMCVREYDFQVPYGVVKLDSHRLVAIEEKPVQRFFVNAGIYVFEPEVLDLVRPNTHLDMPSLFEGLIQKQMEAAVFPIREYWLDIGHQSDLEQAHGDFKNLFQ